MYYVYDNRISCLEVFLDGIVVGIGSWDNILRVSYLKSLSKKNIRLKIVCILLWVYLVVCCIFKRIRNDNK